jgi:hypothetical protein
MNTTTQHTQTPYEAAGGYIRTVRRSDDMRGLSVARMELSNPNREFDAAYIVKACNAHPKLVEVLKAVRNLIQTDRHIPLFLIEAALMEAGEPV